MISHFHPILVHLPLGILPLVALFHFISKNPKYKYLEDAITLSLLISLAVELLSCITGYMLSLEGGYDKASLDAHLNSGILSTLLTMGWLYAHKSAMRKVWKNGAVLVTLASLVVTGHRGGSLTHGENYLFSAGEEKEVAVLRKPIQNIDSALVYEDIVQPILAEKCVSCHGAKKQKGKLRLDQPEKIMLGGKGGAALKWGDLSNSDLLRRIHLPENDDDRMPPKGKTALTKEEMVLLGWWIGSSAGFDKKSFQVGIPDSVRPALESLKKATSSGPVVNSLPEEKVAAPDEQLMANLRAQGLTIVPVAAGSNYLSVHSGPEFRYTDLKFLEPIQKQILQLDLSRVQVKDADLESLKACEHLRELTLARTAVTDAGMKSISLLPQLQKLNLVGTKVSAEGLLALKEIKTLQVIYLFESAVTGRDWGSLRASFPSVRIDTGGYQVPFLETDTQVVVQSKTK